jgi:hypothetical protein
MANKNNDSAVRMKRFAPGCEKSLAARNQRPPGAEALLTLQPLWHE